MKKTKVMSFAMSLALAVSSFAAVVHADETTSYEKIVDLKKADTVFNHVVTSGAPSDVEVYYSNDDGETWLNMDLSKQDGGNGISGLINNDGVIGYLYSGQGNTLAQGTKNTNCCTYASYTADKIKLVSATAALDNTSAKVYNATDKAPASNAISKDNSLITMVAGDGTTKLYSECILDGRRLNNITNTNPAYIYNMDVNKNVLYGVEGKTDNTTADVIVNLDEKTNISKVGLGNVFSGLNNANANLGDRYVISYFDDTKESWVELADVDNTSTGAGRKNHATVNVNAANAVSDKIKITFTFNPNTKNTTGNVQVTCVALSYIGVYDFGANLAMADNFSTPIDLGKKVTFNKLTSDTENITWQYSEDNSTWSAYIESTDMTARYIRAAAEDGIENTPEFELSWEGNLAKYAANGYNGAVISGNKRLIQTWDGIYDGNTRDSAVTVNTNEADSYTMLSLNALASISNITSHWGAGCWYPQNILISTSNKGTNWAEQAKHKFELRTTDGVHDKDSTNHNSFFNNSDDIAVNAAIVKVAYSGSMRAVCGNSATIYDTNMTELVVSGKVGVASYNGQNVSFPVVPDDKPLPAEPTGVEAENIGAYTGADSSVATAFVAEMGDVTGTLDITITPTDGDPKTFNSFTSLTNANVILGIIVNGLNDTAATAVITVQ